MDQTYHDLPHYEIEIEVTTSESPHPPPLPLPLLLPNTKPTDNPVSSQVSLESILTPESNEPDSQGDPTNNNHNNSSESVLTNIAHLQPEAPPVFSVPLSPCSSSHSVRNSPALSPCSDSSSVGGTAAIPVIQWASKVKLEDVTRTKDSRELRPTQNNHRAEERKLDGFNGPGSEDSSEDVVYIGEYRPFVASKQKTLSAASHTHACPQCFRNNDTVPKKLSVSSENLGSQRFSPMRWQNLGTNRFGNSSSLYEPFWKAPRPRQTSCNCCQKACPPVNSLPALFPEPPETEWPYVRVNHMEPKIEVNIRSYTNQF